MKSTKAVAMTYLATLFASGSCFSASISYPDRFQHEGKLNAYLRSMYINTRISNDLIEDSFGGFSTGSELGGVGVNVINLSPQPWPGQEIPGLGRAVAAVPSLVLLPSSAHVRPRRQLNGCRFASAGGISRFPGERVPAAVWPAFLRCSSGAACS
ncbi:hypothetical protein [Pseudomonas rhizophila]